VLLAVLGIIVASGPVQAQASRFEVGQRLRLFESELARRHDAAARKRALGPLVKVTPTFFSGRLAEVARLLDQARFALRSDRSPADEVLWAESLVVRTATRLLDTKTGELALSVEPFYKVEAKRPAAARVRFTLLDGRGKALASATAGLKELPLRQTLDVKALPAGDHTLRSEVLLGGKVAAGWEQTVSLAERLAERLAALRKKVKREDKPASLERATLGSLVELLDDLAARKTPETNHAAARLLAEAEELAAALEAGRAYHGPDRPGQFRLKLVTGETVRVQVPAGLKKGTAVPLVVALHGAGGSENLFFDGYGQGKAAALAAKRGYLMVATRTPLLSLGGPDVMRVVDALAKVYPVDVKKVFLVGHSMGAAQAVAAAVRRPERLAAVAALGGGGSFRAGERVKDVAFFVGCGDQDFLLGGARNLRQALQKGGVKKVVYRQYEDVEHLAVVQLALDDVFTFFDEVAKRGGS
jgi:pimeloyl-ACP methyl ester carboxylesterase